MHAHRNDHVWLSLWPGGAFRAAAFDPSTGRGAPVEQDGRGAVRVVGVTPDSFSESVTTRRASPRGHRVRTSVLSGDADGNVAWDWRVSRPGLDREERINVGADGRGDFRQVDRRITRTTTFTSPGPGRFRGVTTATDGRPLWTSDWTSDRHGGLAATFTDAAGNPAGEARFPTSARQAAGQRVTWTGPIALGFRESKSGDDHGGPYPYSVTRTEGDRTTHTTYEGDGHSVQTGDETGRSWIEITVPDRSGDGSSSVQFGTQTAPHGTYIDYTVNTHVHADGSSDWSRTERNPVNGDRETGYGAADAEGNRSYTLRDEHADGSVTVVTRTVDKNGNGTEHVTTVDAQGNVIQDWTVQVVNGVALTGSAATPAATPVATADDPEEPDEPDDADKSDEDNDDTDDNDDDEDDGTNDGDGTDDGGGDSGRSPDDGGSDDGRPGIPWGKLGHGGKIGDFLAGLDRLTGAGGGDDDDNGTAPELGRRRIAGLTGEVRLGATGGTGGGGADETGWGDGGEGFRGVPLVGGAFSPPPRGADDSGWGDLTDPRALVALVGTFAAATARLANAGPLLRAAAR